MGMDIEEFMVKMDIEMAQWYIDLADERDLKAFARHSINKTIDNKYGLRRATGHRLFVCARVANYGMMRRE
jgi:hypothetical protein